MDIFEEKKLRIPTANQTYLEFAYAGLLRRALATIIDSILILISQIFLLVLLLLLMLLYGLTLAERSSWASLSTLSIVVLASLVLLVLPFAYYFLTETLLSGQTIGKKLLNIRVIRQNGIKVDAVSVLLRNLFRLVDWLPIFSPYILGAWVILLSKNEQRIGDMVAGTLVISLPKKADASKTSEITSGLPSKASMHLPSSEKLARIKMLSREYLTRRDKIPEASRDVILERLALLLDIPRELSREQKERAIYERLKQVNGKL